MSWAGRNAGETCPEHPNMAICDCDCATLCKCGHERREHWYAESGCLGDHMDCKCEGFEVDE